MIKPGIYRHYKGKEYQLLGLARHSETMEELRLYHALYYDRKLCGRTKHLFTETIVVNGKKINRFEWIKPI